MLTEIPTPYRLPVMERLLQLDEADITFLFCARKQRDRDWTEESIRSVKGKFLPGFQFTRISKSNSVTYFFNPSILLTLVKEKFDIVFVAGWAQPTMFLAILYCLMTRTPYVMMSESHAMKPRGWLKRLVRKIYPGGIIRRAAAFLVTGRRAVEYLQTLGASSEEIFVYPNTIDVPYFKR